MPRPRRTRRTPPVPIASMGDIAFLLIIFFLLLSEFAKDNNVQVTLPASENVKKSKITAVARVAVDREGVIYFDGTRMDNVKDVEWGIRALLTNTVTDDQRHVEFKCDAALPKETFEPVLKAIAEGGGIIDAVGERRRE